jgi:hypothetical protein
MIPVVTHPRILAARALTLSLALLCATAPAFAQKKQPQLEKPLAGPRATALQVTWLYVAADKNSQKVDRPMDPGVRQHRH